MPIEIRETIISHATSGDEVQLHISDSAMDDGNATLRMTIVAKVPPARTPALAHHQRAAMKVAQDALTPILQDLVRDLKDAGLPLDPPPRGR